MNIDLSLINPVSIARFVVVSILRPNTMILRLFLRHVSTICLTRYILEANVAIIIRPLYPFTISDKASSTVFSYFEKPSDKAFVLSLNNSFTPLEPTLAILCKSAIGPIGVKSNLKSPVDTIVPFGV